MIQRNNPKILKDFFTKPEDAITFNPDWESKIQSIISEYSQENITMTMGVTSWNLFLLRSLVAFHNVQYVDDIWPDYELFLTGGMSYKPYEKQIRGLFRKPIQIWQCYNSSEGFFGIQCENNTYTMKLLSHDVFYEFIILDDYRIGEYDNVVTCEYVQNAIQYVVLITNSS